MEDYQAAQEVLNEILQSRNEAQYKESGKLLKELLSVLSFNECHELL